MHTIPPRAKNEVEGLAQEGEARESRAASQPLLDAITRQAHALCGLPVSLADLLDDRPPSPLDQAETRAFRGLAEITVHALALGEALQQAELTLRASAAFLERTGRVAGVGGWEMELASGTITWSDETRRIHEVGPGYHPTLASALRFYAPEAQPVIEAAVQRGVDEGTPWDLELPFITATGRAIWVRAMGQVEFGDGRAVKLMGAFQDITERRQLEQRVADNERFLRQLADSLRRTLRKRCRASAQDGEARSRSAQRSQHLDRHRPPHRFGTPLVLPQNIIEPGCARQSRRGHTCRTIVMNGAFPA